MTKKQMKSKERRAKETRSTTVMDPQYLKVKE